VSEFSINTKTSLEFIDYLGNKITLNDYYYQHIIKAHGSEMTSFYKNWIETLKNPDIVGNGKRYKDCKIYIQKNKKSRNFPAKYLVIVVNEINLITSIRFGRNLNFLENLVELKNE
jgi:hypothetical protein